jgi:hypothetical protein
LTSAGTVTFYRERESEKRERKKRERKINETGQDTDKQGGVTGRQRGRANNAYNVEQQGLLSTDQS